MASAGRRRPAQPSVDRKRLAQDPADAVAAVQLEPRVLEHHPDVAAVGAAGRAAGVGEVGAGVADASAVRANEAGQDAHERALARPGGAEQADDLTLAQGQVDVNEGPGAPGIGDAHALGGQQPSGGWGADAGVAAGTRPRGARRAPRRRGGHEPAALDRDRAVAQPGDEVGVVRDEEQRQPAVGAQGGEQRHDPFASGEVEVGGGLVGDQERGVTGQRRGDAGPLAHPA